MKKLIVTVCSLYVFVIAASAQGVEKETRTSANASQIFLELGGLGIAYSVNYDGRFRKIENGFGIRVGLGGSSSGGSGYIAVPAQLNYLLGNNGQYLELGLGATYISSASNFFDTNTTQSSVFGTATIGFRKQPFGKKGIMWKIAFTPLFGGNGIGFQPWLGAGIGYRF